VESRLAEADFFKPQAREATAGSVRSVEALTSAEVVVTVRRKSGDYRPAAYHFAFGVTALVVLYLLITPEIYSVGAIALEAALSFVLGLTLALGFRPLLRLLVRSRTLEQRVQDAAKVAFFDLGISRTKARTGVLVFVSTFERRCAVLTDSGIDVSALGLEWPKACAELTRGVAARDFAAFQRALESLGPMLGARLPRSADDVNELADEVR
jgi:putative membrane protein